MTTEANIAWPLVGHDTEKSDFLDAADTNRLHHGWIIEGPSGIGKARLARKMAAFMLGADCQKGTLDSLESDPIIQKIKAGAHPDLRWIQREPDEKGHIKQDIPVDAMRTLNDFFSLKPAMGGWRIGVIDSIDELNRFGANAILKTLEEPPSNCLMILISHRTKSVLPTIRSRCRMLRLNALDETETRVALELSDDQSAREIITQTLARGRPGLGLRLASRTGIAATKASRNYLRGLPKPSDAALSEILIRGGEDAIAFEAMSYDILAWLSAKSEDHVDYALCWLKTARLVAQVSELNMDRTQATAKLIAGLQKATASM